MEAWILRKTVDELLRVRLVMWLGTSLRESTNWIYGDYSFSEERIWDNLIQDTCGTTVLQQALYGITLHQTQIVRV